MIWQLPVPPVVVHGFNVVNDPGPPSIVKKIGVPFGAFTKPAPLPLFTFTCAVNTWFVPTGFVAVCGAIWMFASTNVFTPSLEFGATPSVATVTGTPPTLSVEVACPRTLPAVGEVNVIVHRPFASVFAPAFVHVPVGVV